MERGAHLFHHGISFEHEFVVVVQIRKLLLRQLDPTWARDIVDSTLLKNIIERIALEIKTCGTDLAALVQQIHAEQLPVATFIMPRLDCRFVCAASFDGPFVCIRVKCFDGEDVGMCSGG